MNEKQKPKEIEAINITELNVKIDEFLTVKPDEKQPVINHICMNNEGTKVLIIYSEREPIVEFDKID